MINGYVPQNPFKLVLRISKAYPFGEFRLDLLTFPKKILGTLEVDLKSVEHDIIKRSFNCPMRKSILKH